MHFRSMECFTPHRTESHASRLRGLDIATSTHLQFGFVKPECAWRHVDARVNSSACLRTRAPIRGVTARWGRRIGGAFEPLSARAWDHRSSTGLACRARVAPRASVSPRRRSPARRRGRRAPSSPARRRCRGTRRGRRRSCCLRVGARAALSGARGCQHRPLAARPPPPYSPAPLGQVRSTSCA